ADDEITEVAPDVEDARIERYVPLKVPADLFPNLPFARLLDLGEALSVRGRKVIARGRVSILILGSRRFPLIGRGRRDLPRHANATLPPAGHVLGRLPSRAPPYRAIRRLRIHRQACGGGAGPCQCSTGTCRTQSPEPRGARRQS